MPAALQSGAVWAREADGKVVVRATRVTRPLRVDGRLDDETYREVPAITEMIQATPVAGAPGTDRTEAWVLFDDKKVYISLRCWQDPARIVGNDMRRDNNNNSRHDHIAVAFDTFYDGRNGYQFNMSAAGGLRDGHVTNERYDANWNGVLDGAASRFKQRLDRRDGDSVQDRCGMRHGRDQTWASADPPVPPPARTRPCTSRRCSAARHRGDEPVRPRRHAGRARGAARRPEPRRQAIRDFRGLNGHLGAPVSQRLRRRMPVSM